MNCVHPVNENGAFGGTVAAARSSGCRGRNQVGAPVPAGESDPTPGGTPICRPAPAGARVGDSIPPASPAAPGFGRPTMNAVLNVCCGLDVHKKFVTACLLMTGASGRVTKEHRQFGTTTTEVLELLA